MGKYTEIFKLKEMLETANIPHVFIDRTNEGVTYESWQILYPNVERYSDKRVCSCVQGYGTYGAEQDLLEIMGLLTDKEYEDDSVLGYLTAEEVFERIKKHYDEQDVIQKGDKVMDENNNENNNENLDSNVFAIKYLEEVVNELVNKEDDITITMEVTIQKVPTLYAIQLKHEIESEFKKLMDSFDVEPYECDKKLTVKIKPHIQKGDE